MWYSTNQRFVCLCQTKNRKHLLKNKGVFHLKNTNLLYKNNLKRNLKNTNKPAYKQEKHNTIRPRFYLPFGYGKILIHSFVKIVVKCVDIF